MLAAADTIDFGRWRLDPQRRVLCADGVPVTLNSRAFDLLSFLVANHGRVVSRTEIVAYVWPNIAVGDNNLTVQMSALRHVLDEHGDGGLIVTVTGRGYRFVGEVVPASPPEAAVCGPVEALPFLPVPAATPPGLPVPAATPPGPPVPAAAPPGRRRLILGAAIGGLLLASAGVLALRHAAPAAPRLSIAVLPLRNLSPDRAQDYLADALTDDLTTDLAHIPAAIVISRQSADAWRGRAVPVQQIGRALDVRYLVEGSLRAEDGQYHVNAQLVDAASGAHLWAERFDSPSGRMSDVRTAIVRRIASALDFQLVHVESARSSHDRPDNPDALDLFFQARAILDQDDTLAGLVRAQHYLERAIEQQPDFADALAELGALLVVKVRDRDDPDDAADYDEAQRMVGRALALSPRNARALASEGRMLAIGGNWTAAQIKAEEALAIEPSSVDAEVVLAACAQQQGRLDDALLHLHAILRLSPDNPMNRSRFMMIGYVLLMQGRINDAVDTLHQATAGEADTDMSESMGRVEITRLLLIAATSMQGDVQRARAMYAEYSLRWPNRTVWRFGGLISRPNARLPGYSRIMSALQEAGMPMYADEHVNGSLAKQHCEGDNFAQTPGSLNGARVLDTRSAASEIMSAQPPLVIDVGRGVAIPGGAEWFDEGNTSGTTAEFASRVMHTHAVARGTPIIVMGNGVYGCGSYEAATRLISEGFTDVQWYRGGEEAWAAAGLPHDDRRPN